jgi:hypothetical protein
MNFPDYHCHMSFCITILYFMPNDFRTAYILYFIKGEAALLGFDVC